MAAAPAALAVTGTGAPHASSAATAVDPNNSMLSKRFVLGAQSDVKDGCCFTDESTLWWVAGRSIVVYNSQTGAQKFIPSSPTSDGISALAVSPSRKMVAVAETGDNPGIVIFDTATRKRKRYLQVPDVGSREFVCLAFSIDGKHLVSLGGFPEWNVVLWSVDKSKAVAMTSAADRGQHTQDRRLMNQCSLSPRDSSLICVSGNGVFKFFKYSDGQLRQAPGGLGRNEPMNYLAHVWLPPEDRIIVSTDNGDLLLVENGEYLHHLPLSPSDGLSIDTLIAHSKGFVCGGDMGLVTIFERSEDKELYRKMRTLKVEQNDRKDGDGGGSGGGSSGGGLTTMAGSEDSVRVLAFTLTPAPSEEIAAILTSTHQLFMLNLANADFSKADDRVTEVVAQPFHAGPITGLDICVRKPLIVTCGKDRRVILWNYLTHTAEIVKTFATEVLSVAIHPSGLHLLVGFPDKLRFMNIYGDDIRESRSFSIRSCTECRFSHGGQFFAAMHATIVHVYFTYTCELLGHLRGHNGKIKHIRFVAPDDNRILTAGVDGAIYEFSLSDFHKIGDHTIKAISYSSVSCDDQFVWAAGNDRKIRQLDRQHLAPSAEHDLQNAAAVCLTQSIQDKLLFAGCEDGTLRAFSTLLAQKNLQGRQVTEKSNDGTDPEGGGADNKAGIMVEAHVAHVGPVTRIEVSFDESILVSVGDDGVLVVWDIFGSEPHSRHDIEFAEEILIDKKDLEDRNKTIEDLQDKVAELKQRMEHQHYKRELKHEERMQELKDRFAEGRQRQSKLLEQLISEKNDQAIKFTETFSALEEAHRQDMTKIDQEYSAKIRTLEDQCAKLQLAIDEQRAEFESAKNIREKNAAEAMEALKRNHTTQLKEMSDSIAQLRLDKETGDTGATEVCGQIEFDTDAEIMDLKERYEHRMKVEQDQCAKLRSENSVLQSKENMVRADLDAKRAEKEDKMTFLKTLDSQIKNFEKDLAALNHELTERSETIQDKEKRIYDLKKKNEELGKFRFVLEYKIAELRDQIEPREAEIKAATAKYAEMEVESERYLHMNESLVLTIRGLKLKLDGQSKEMDSLNQRLASAEDFQRRLHTELTDLYEEGNPRRMKELTKALYYQHTAPRGTSQLVLARGADDPQRDYNRSRDYLERTVSGLKKKLVKDNETNRADRCRIVSENVTLIREINELRREVRTLQNQKRGTVHSGPSGEDNSVFKELEMQRLELQRLRSRAEELERQAHAVGKPVSMPAA